MFTYLALWTLWHIYRIDRFSFVTLSGLRKGELRLIVSILALFAFIFQFIYDASRTHLKYFGEPMPDSEWSDSSKTLQAVADYFEMVFWNYIARSYTNASFMSSIEFKLYIIWSIVSVAFFPLLRFIFENDSVKREMFPQLAYGIELLVVAFLGLSSHHRFLILINECMPACETSGTSHVYFMDHLRDVNLYLTTALIANAISLMALAIDDLSGAMHFSNMTFMSDLLIMNVNFTGFVVWLSVIQVLHSKYKTRMAPTTTDPGLRGTNKNATTPSMYVEPDSCTMSDSCLHDSRRQLNWSPIFGKAFEEDEAADHKVYSFMVDPQLQPPISNYNGPRRAIYNLKTSSETDLLGRSVHDFQARSKTKRHTNFHR
ncbi:uncharacterized protein VTP21DRAFT_9402 [Calcarisporiella thermophila]|uniref:uncharacterized protein n=1 Tax=Calcarisporiella thermophila TaxID=911321 RepID=UPI0037448403